MLLCRIIVFTYLVSTSLNVFAGTNGSTHSWEITKANIDSSKVSYHELNNTKYTFSIITYNSSYNRECKICGANDMVDETIFIHLNADCTKYN
ncbi:hypothetical protein FDF86_00245 [Clostridium botulinum]|nr:hypothetical protein [Clostridium botulinum]